MPTVEKQGTIKERKNTVDRYEETLMRLVFRHLMEEGESEKSGQNATCSIPKFSCVSTVQAFSPCSGVLMLIYSNLEKQ